jgi:hypothetical protein
MAATPRRKEVMRMRLLGLLMIAAVPAFGQSAPTPCSTAEFKQIDFWLGDWDARWEASPGTPAGKGSNHITRTYDGCVTEEHFDGAPLQGHSVSTYLVSTKNWRQTWVDNQGAYIDLAGGPDSAGNFVLTTLPKSGTAAASRMLFTDIKPNSFTWRWQATQDGKVWADSWVIHYVRRKS